MLCYIRCFHLSNCVFHYIVFNYYMVVFDSNFQFITIINFYHCLKAKTIMSKDPTIPVLPSGNKSLFKKGRPPRKCTGVPKNTIRTPQPSKVLNPCSIQLPLSTWAASLLIQMLFHMLEQNAVNVNCSRFQLYCILLYSISVKICKQFKVLASWITQPELPQYIIEQITVNVTNTLFIPEPFVKYVEHLGQYDSKTVSAMWFMPNFEGPHPLYTTISNVQGTVFFDFFQFPLYSVFNPRNYGISTL